MGKALDSLFGGAPKEEKHGASAILNRLIPPVNSDPVAFSAPSAISTPDQVQPDSTPSFDILKGFENPRRIGRDAATG